MKIQVLFATIEIQFNGPKLYIYRAWLKIITHIDPVIQGMRYVMQGNLYIGLGLPGGGFCVINKKICQYLMHQF